MAKVEVGRGEIVGSAVYKAMTGQEQDDQIVNSRVHQALAQGQYLLSRHGAVVSTRT